MEEFDDIPDENTIEMMNGAYARARVRRDAVKDVPGSGRLPEHIRGAAEECVKQFSRINACIRAFFERSAHGREVLREILPMSESLLAKSRALAGAEEERENIPLASAAVCRRILTDSLNKAVIILFRLSAYSESARELMTETLALAYLVRAGGAA